MSSTPTLCLALALLNLACGHTPEEAAQPGAWPVRVAADSSSPPAFERVVLVTIDTLRADHLSGFGYPRATSPFLDALAREGVSFRHATAAVSYTAPSHSTMLTGLVPAVHGVLTNGASLDPHALDLAGLFARHGFETAAFLNVGFLKAIATSFETCAVLSTVAGGPEVRGDQVVDAALAWLSGGRRTARFLLWVHLYDVHQWKEFMLAHEGHEGSLWSGASPPDFLERVTELQGLPAPEPGKPYAIPWEGREVDKTGKYTAGRIEECIDAYDECLLFADHQVERLHAGLEALGLPGKTLWIVTADHGEGMASHGYPGHTNQIWQEQLHVPLIVAASDGSLGPRSVDELVGHVDLLPTLAETIGVRLEGDPAVFEGRSLWPLLRGERVDWGARLLFSQKRPPEDPKDKHPQLIYSVQSASHKLLRVLPDGEQLFDLRADPRELAPLPPGDPAGAVLRKTLDARLEAYAPFANREAAPVPEEFLQELRDLGYAR